MGVVGITIAEKDIPFPGLLLQPEVVAESRVAIVMDQTLLYRVLYFRYTILNGSITGEVQRIPDLVEAHPIVALV